MKKHPIFLFPNTTTFTIIPKMNKKSKNSLHRQRFSSIFWFVGEDWWNEMKFKPPPSPPLTEGMQKK